MRISLECTEDNRWIFNEGTIYGKALWLPSNGEVSCAGWGGRGRSQVTSMGTTPQNCLFYPHHAWLSDFMLAVSETDGSFSFQLANALLFKQAMQKADALGDWWQGTSVVKQWLHQTPSFLAVRALWRSLSASPTTRRNWIQSKYVRWEQDTL